jgi:hypothetical protein
MSTLSRWLILAALALAASPASAQRVGGVANSGMGQGEARITSRSDVRLSMESMPGTSGAAVSALGQRVGSSMTAIRTCYEERIEENPTVTGTLRLRFLLENRGNARVEIDNDGVGDREVVRCITNVLEGLPSRDLSRPTRAVVQLVLANSAARGVAQASQQAQRAQAVVLNTDAQGNPTASGGTDDQRVTFVVTGEGSGSGETVAAAHRALMIALPGLLDCRRRSGRRGEGPGGDLTASMQILVGRSPTARMTASTVPNENTRSCVGRVLGRIEHRPTEGRGRVSVRIHFEPASPVEAQE